MLFHLISLPFFVSFIVVLIYNITSQNNASISNFGGSFRWKSEYPWCILEAKSKHFPTVFKKIEKKKMTEKREFIRKTNNFRPNRFFYMVTIEIFFKFLRNLSKTRKFAMNSNPLYAIKYVWLRLYEYVLVPIYLPIYNKQFHQINISKE
ncbi:Uncharacterized protein FWK35_00016103 [Aphis craccivora]|uniref:Uncharacterized protein n=1 Tax=Aphis craccivora TaxID=307492 RepID=A0A6G0Y661_APHCR|nr:Uncharacterized protein FWK35_00016103 [Aphis craccivora]